MIPQHLQEPYCHQLETSGTLHALIVPLINTVYLVSGTSEIQFTDSLRTKYIREDGLYEEGIQGTLDSHPLFTVVLQVLFLLQKPARGGGGDLAVLIAILQTMTLRRFDLL